jgi:hypothetical protein
MGSDFALGGWPEGFFTPMNSDHEQAVALHIHEDSIEFDDFYEIPFDRIDTHEKLVRWIYHLHRKSWFSADLAGQMIRAASLKHNWPIHMHGI